MDNRMALRTNPAMGRRTLFGLLAISAGAALVGCSNATGNDSGTSALSICASFYPMYDFASKVAGDLRHRAARLGALNHGHPHHHHLRHACLQRRGHGALGL